MPILTLDEARTSLNKTSPADDAEITVFMAAAEDIACSIRKGPIAAATFTDRYNGGLGLGGSVGGIVLRQRPVISITTVVENGVTLAPTAYTVTDSDVLWRSYGYQVVPFAYGTANIVVTYVAGFTTIPPRAKHGVKEILSHLWDTQRGAMQQPSRGQGDDYIEIVSGYMLPRRIVELFEGLSDSGFSGS